MMEYIGIGVLVLALLGLAVWSVATSGKDQGDTLKDSIDAMPTPPAWQ